MTWDQQTNILAEGRKAVECAEGTPPPPCRILPASFCVPASKQHVFHLESPHRHFLPSDTTSVPRQRPGCTLDGAPGVGGAPRRAELLRPRFHMRQRLQLPRTPRSNSPTVPHNERAGLDFTSSYTLQPGPSKQCVALMPRGPAFLKWSPFIPATSL